MCLQILFDSQWSFVIFKLISSILILTFNYLTSIYPNTVYFQFVILFPGKFSILSDNFYIFFNCGKNCAIWPFSKDMSIIDLSIFPITSYIHGMCMTTYQPITDNSARFKPYGNQTIWKHNSTEANASKSNGWCKLSFSALTSNYPSSLWWIRLNLY